MRTTDRDLDVLRFVLDMKFATIADVHSKFFKQRRDGKISESMWYARERLRKLIQRGHLEMVRYRFENVGYYKGTEEGYWFVRNSDMFKLNLPKPVKKIDIRTFEHDRNVTSARLLLEEREGVTDWQSDRQLKANYYDYFTSRPSRDFCPDGVYKAADGKIVAFEYELAQKSKKRYQDKIKQYIDCIENVSQLDRPGYQHVHFVCEQKCIASYLRSETVLYKNYFTIQTREEFEQQVPAGAPTNCAASIQDQTM